MTHTSRALIVALLLCLPAIASADAFYDTYQRGLAAFKARDYAAARVEFQRAYDLRAEPLVLFNIAQTYRLEESPEQALVYYRRFLAESKIAEDLRAEAQRHVTDLEAQQAKRDAQRELEANTGPKEPDGSAVTVPPSLPIERPLVSPTAVAEPQDETTAPGPSVIARRRRVPTSSKIALGVGAAGAAGSVLFGILGKRAESDLQDNPNATQADADGVEAYETAINVSLGIAAAATVTSVLFYVVAPAYSSDGAIVVSPTRAGGWAATLTLAY